MGGYFPKDQSARSAIIFLNALGLKLEEKEDVNSDTELSVLNSSNEPVGILYFDGDLVKIKAECSFGTLSAEYERVYYTVLFDKDRNKKFLDWSNNIRFHIFKNEHERIEGSFSVSATVDEDGEKRVTILPAPIKYIVDGKRVYDFSIVRYDDTFASVIGDENGHEEIDFNSRRIMHNRVNINGSEERIVSQDGEDVTAYYRIYQKGKIVGFGDISQELLEKDPERRAKQMVRMMLQVNPSIKRRLHEIKSVFCLDDVDLVDNFIGVTEPSDDVYELLGFKKKPIVYQNGSTDVTDAYFESVNSDKAKEIVKK